MKRHNAFFATLLLCVMPLLGTAQTQFHNLSLDDAINLAKKENKLVFIDFYTDWCGPCKNMARQVFPQKKVGDFLNSKFVCLKLNAEKEGKELAAKYNVKAYPTYVVLDTNTQPRMHASGAMNADEFIYKVEMETNPNNAPERMKRLYDAGKHTPELINNYAFYLLGHQQEEEGFKVVNNYFKTLSPKDRLKAENAFIFTRYTLNLNDEKGLFMTQNLDRFDTKSRSLIKARTQLLFRNAVYQYFSGYMWKEKKYNETDYLQLKKQVETLQLHKDYPYAPMFALIESRVKDYDLTFLSCCNREYNNLDANDRTLLILNLTRLFDTQDKTTLKQLSAFIRSHLFEMDAKTIIYAGQILSEIEQ